ncbi:CocE/NonD family hydrolase [Yoonia vestfoldensis]|uniref:Cocaine esterase n=1 Tax=Yoonia vestfoldensis TaxID=245188 RepID=A0A1Y0EB65_9RHOB|nr:CocE/NonD family hydrolase [Yoonia vestfoldensis]ARU00865.1 cocaine esterase [Yoonia vestfoldensis]
MAQSAGASTDPAGLRVLDPVWITMRDGTRLAARIWMPKTAAHNAAPAVLEYLPYRRRDATLPRDELTHSWLAQNGYVGVRVDIRGSGDSDGHMSDEYSAAELDDGLQVIAWLAAQSWCNGAVGMIGISWGGFNALQLAQLAPPALKAAVAICFTDDRYADDIHYMGGCLLTENKGWSSQMLAYSARPPDPEILGEAWRDIWLDRLRTQPLHIETWLAHQRRDAYWKRGSVCEDYGGVTAAILAVGGWADAYSNAVPRTIAGLSSPVAGINGPWAHRYPNVAWPEPAIGFLSEVKAWFDHWLKGEGTAPDMSYRMFVMESDPPARHMPARNGRWIAEQSWPSPRIGTEIFYLSQHGLGETQGDAPLYVTNPQTIGLAGQRFCPGMRSLDELADDQRADDAQCLTLDTSPFVTGKDIVGAARLKLRLIADQTSGFVVARLCDLRPDGSVAFITMGVMNLTHDDGHVRVTPLIPGRPVDVTFSLNDIAYRLPAGHCLRLSLSTAYWPMIWPSAAPLSLQLDPTGCALTLPVRPDINEASPQFGPPEQMRQGRSHVLRAAAYTRQAEILPDGTQRLQLITDAGLTRHESTGIESGKVITEIWDIHPDDPLTARHETRWRYTIGRAHWQTRTETRTVMTCDATSFHIAACLQAYEGKDCLVARDWQFSVPRDGT